jgi:4-amino-4-deoxy-L-arabinose transferase-like glycosyltransferase
MIRYLWRIVFVLLCIYVLFYIANSLIIIIYPYQISYPEGFLLNQALTIAQGRPIYNSIADYPFLVANYPPLYPYLCGFFVKIFSVSFAWGRIVSFLSVIACAYLIYDICKNIPLTLTLSHEGRGMEIKTSGHERHTALIAFLLFLASPYVYKISVQCRVDMLGLAFSLLGLWFAVKHIDKKTMYFSILFFIAALFTKQTFAAALIAFAVYLFIQNRTRGFLFIVITLLSYSVIFLVLNILTAGEFYKHNVLYNANPYSFLFAVRMYASLLRTHVILITLSLAYLVFSPVKKHILSLFPIYFIVAALVALTVGKIGSNINYFLELIAAACIMTGLCVNELLENTKAQLVLPALFIVQLILFVHIPFVTGKTPSRYDRETERQISAMIQTTPGDILSEDAGLLVLNKRPVLFQPFEFTQLARAGLWNQRQFVRDIENKKFSLLILGSDIQGPYDEERFTSEMAAAIANSYVLQEKIGDWYTYKPKKNE